VKRLLDAENGIPDGIPGTHTSFPRFIDLLQLEMRYVSPDFRKVGLGLFCPVTSKIKGYPFEVLLRAGLPISGAILADQIKNLGWQARNA
jgi:hypothetical protein